MRAKRRIRRAWIAALPALVGAAVAPASALAASADLAVSKRASKATVAEGEAFLYIVTVANRGPDAASQIEVIDRVSPPARARQRGGDTGIVQDRGRAAG